jgi:hypothetical protein
MKILKLWIAPLILITVFVLVHVLPISADKIEIDQFISPETCSDCHDEIYGQWQNSMHNLSHNDPVYLLVSGYFLKGLTHEDEVAEAESCVKCHTPVGNVSGFPEKSSDDRSKVSEIATHGIQCDYCHSATGAEKMYNNGIILEPGHGEDDPGIKRGPLDDCETEFHDTMFSEFHTSAEICGTCHNVKHVRFNTNLETTYDEWKNGPYNSEDPEKRVTCQQCHMRQRPGIPSTGSTDRPDNPGYAASWAVEREHVPTHYFVGGNSYVPGSYRDTVKPGMAEERLQNAALLTVDDGRLKQGKIDITIKNSGAGHFLPTGLTDVRQMWLEIIVEDQKGSIVYSSGCADENGYLPKNSYIYNTVFGDGNGNEILNISKAREILKDNRIPPLESKTEAISLPEGERKNLTVNVRLLYRIASQKIIDTIAEKGKYELPVIVMAEVEKKI